MAYALITGASGGIGLALARELASRKHDVILVARTQATLEKHAVEIATQHNVRTKFLALDLAKEESSTRLAEWVKTENLDVNILINNAGFGFWGKLEDIPRGELSQMMQLNMVTLADVCKLFIPQLREQPKAYILNVASTAAYQAVPTLTTYAATKAFVLLFTRGLRWELKGTSVSVSCLSPGTTSTGFIDRAGMEKIRKKAEKVTMSPEAVAKIAVNGMLQGKAEIIPGALNWISAKFAEILPKSLPERIARGIYED